MQFRSLGVEVALATLVVLAGCSAFGTAGSGTDERSVTPVPVPTADLGPPPGVTAGGITAPERLGNAHERHLTNRSYAVTVVRTIRFANGTTVWRSERGRRVGGDGVILSWRQETERERPGTATVVGRRAWTNGSVRVLRSQYGNGTTRYRVTASHQRYPYRRTAHTIARTLADENAVVVASDTDPTTYTLVSKNLSDEWATNTDLDRVETSSIRAVVTGTGLLQRTTVRHTGTRNGAPAVDSSTIRFDTDPKAVTRPAWVETALEQRSSENERSAEHTQTTG